MSEILKQTRELNKLQKRLRRQVSQAITDYNMIQDGDKVMICLSGGKDSYTLLDILINIQQHALTSFKIVAVNLDQKQPGFPEHILPTYLKSINVPFHIIEKDTYSIVREKIPKGKTTCSICSRLRRGSLYSYARQNNITKIALGHHRDDIIETTFLNMFYGGKIKAMPPKLLSDDKTNIVIRPLSYSRELDIAHYAKWRKFPIIPCNLCGSQDKSQRLAIKKMLQGWNKQYPGRIENIFRSLQNISPSQLADNELFNFKNLELHRQRPTEKVAPGHEQKHSS